MLVLRLALFSLLAAAAAGTLEAQRVRGAAGGPQVTRVWRTVSGSLRLPFGQDVAGAAVRTSAGGEHAVLPDGSFAFGVLMPSADTSLEVEARASVSGVAFSAAKTLAVFGGAVDAGVLELARAGAAFPAEEELELDGSALFAGDFDSDGDLDLATSRTDPFTLVTTVHVALGDGRGGFGPAATYATGLGSDFDLTTDLEGGDLDGDLDVDLVVRAIQGEVAVLPGNGDGTFGAPSWFSSGLCCSTHAFELGDLDADGDLDWVGVGGSAYQVMLGNGDGTFASPLTTSTGACCNSQFALGDVDGDPFLDLVITAGSIQVRLGAGDGTFAAPISSPLADFPHRIALADLDGSSGLDLLVAQQSGNVAVHLANGDGTFAEAVLYPGTGFAEGDADGDGDLDLVVQNSGLELLRGNGDGTFADGERLGRLDSTPFALLELDGEDGLDLVVHQLFGFAVLLGKSDGTVEAPQPLAAGAMRAALVDLDADGDLDVAAPATVLIANGDGSFAPPVHFAVGPAPFDIACGDLDGLGRLDLVTANSSGNSLSVLLASGAGYGPQIVLATGRRPTAVALADFELDGDLDIVATNANDRTVKLFFGNGAGGFVAGPTLSVGTTPDAVRAADLDHDLDPDLVVVNNGSHDLSLLFGNGNGTFAAQVLVPAGGFGPEGLALGDWNGDGELDLATANTSSGTVSVLRGLGNGTFLAASTIVVGTSPLALAAGDVDGDGLVDLVVACTNDYGVALLHGNGAGGFVRSTRHALGVRPTSVALGDLDADGDPDLVVANGEVGYLSVLFGRSVP